MESLKEKLPPAVKYARRAKELDKKIADKTITQEEIEELNQCKHNYYAETGRRLTIATIQRS